MGVEEITRGAYFGPLRDPAIRQVPPGSRIVLRTAVRHRSPVNGDGRTALRSHRGRKNDPGSVFRGDLAGASGRAIADGLATGARVTRGAVRGAVYRGAWAGRTGAHAYALGPVVQIVEATKGAWIAGRHALKPSRIGPRITAPHGEMRTALRRHPNAPMDAHHVVQQAAVRDLPGASRGLTPTVALKGGGRATPHGRANAVQREASIGGTLGDEFIVGRAGMAASGKHAEFIEAVMEETIADFVALGFDASTLTRVPRNRYRMFRRG